MLFIKVSDAIYIHLSSSGELHCLYLLPKVAGLGAPVRGCSFFLFLSDHKVLGADS